MTFPEDQEWTPEELKQLKQLWTPEEAKVIAEVWSPKAYQYQLEKHGKQALRLETCFMRALIAELGMDLGVSK